ncbi:MAG: sugar ABC transporter permease [Anaerolineales bacterium]|nr:sugar ABC transporter permease [Anaerolineales bacterium]MCB0010733.1 sugar ABC transporter permease [Anaerolineales bacterium]MCB0017720.1 sugar ABC transporter permease [Anaerolineales bacterium]MCB0027251.1 sugar ABC transporter permease [Anaerolineales bacterium]MCB8959421.1 sugar ABC transporter permease [Ardenticatenales bacterium]
MAAISANKGGGAKKSGSEVARREARLAYLLLAPTLLVLIVIAFYPLGSVFYNSLTDAQFASSEETNFIGGENFKNLLSMTIRELPPKVDENGNTEIDPETGEAVLESPVNVLPREPIRFREYSRFGFFGTTYVIGAADQEFIAAIVDTVKFTIATVSLELVLGLGIALVVNANFAGRGLMRVMMLVPWAIPTAVSSRIWIYMLQSDRRGFFNVIFQILGFSDGQIPFLVDDRFQLLSAIAIDVWKTTPFMALLLLAGLQLIPSSLYEAADVDGASKFRQFWNITLPMLRPTIAIALVFRTLDALRVFDMFQIVFQQKRYSLASYAYYELINGQRMGYSSAASVVIFIIIMIFAILYIRMLGVSNE